MLFKTGRLLLQKVLDCYDKYRASVCIGAKVVNTAKWFRIARAHPNIPQKEMIFKGVDNEGIPVVDKDKLKWKTDGIASKRHRS